MAKKNTKDKIFNISIDLFSKYGYDGVSIRQIAKETGIKESSIYNHYPSKESILESILNYYITEMLKEEAPLMQSSENLDLGFDHFYKIGSERFISKLGEEKMMKITRIFLVESYHNQKINNFLKEAIIGYGIKGWIELFELMKEKNVIKRETNSKQLAESFYYYGLFLLYEHFIINYPEDDDKFLEDFVRRTTDHMKIIYNSVKIPNEENKVNKENKEIIRLEEKKDYREVENLVRDAFWNVYRPGAYEHYIVHNLRKDSSFIKGLSFVIEKDDEIIGHIIYSKGKIEYEDGNTEEAIVLGPLAIAKSYQNMGYGSKLIQFTLNLINEKSFVFVIGDENYYSKFGFESASKYNIFLEGTDTNEENPFFMVKILNKKRNNKTDHQNDRGIYSNPSVFNVNEKDVDEFDKQFKFKEKKTNENQLKI